MNLTEHDKVQIAKIKPSTKIKALSPEHSEYIQKLSFEAGFTWPISGKQVKYTDEPCICFNNDSTISWSRTFEVTKNYTYKEILIDLPINEVKPPFKLKKANFPIVRQWLKDNGYTFKRLSYNIMEWNIEDLFGYVDSEGHFSTSNDPSCFIKHEYPEITFDMCIVSVTVKRDKELESLKSELKKARRAVEEIERKISNIKE